jgi:hypothetical protein
MDTRLIASLSRRRAAHDFLAYGRQVRRRAVAGLRSNSPRSEVEPLVESARLAFFLARMVGAHETEVMREEHKRRKVLGSSPTIRAPRIAPRVLYIPVLSDPVLLDHAPHAPPTSILPSGNRPQTAAHRTSAGDCALRA